MRLHHGADDELHARQPDALRGHPQQRIPAHRQHHLARQSRSQAAAQRHTEMVDDPIEPRGASGRLLRDASTEQFTEDLALARGIAAAKPPPLNPEPDAAAVCRQILQLSYVVAMEPRRSLAASGARRIQRDRVGADHSACNSR